MKAMHWVAGQVRRLTSVLLFLLLLVFGNLNAKLSLQRLVVVLLQQAASNVSP